jgi:hypothetical protein
MTVTVADGNCTCRSVLSSNTLGASSCRVFVCAWIKAYGSSIGLSATTGGSVATTPMQFLEVSLTPIIVEIANEHTGEDCFVGACGQPTE